MKRPNIVLLTIDCLRADRVGCLGYERQTTPNIDDLARTGVLFEQAISVGASTAPSFISMFTSSYPLMYGGQLWMESWRTTLAQVLQQSGYRTAAFHCNPWISSYYGYQKGFETFDDGLGKYRVESMFRKPKELVKRTLRQDSWPYKMLERVHAEVTFNSYANAQALNAKAARWLASNSSDFFLWIHYLDAHEPYVPSPGWRRLPERYRALRLDWKAHGSPHTLTVDEINELTELYDSKVTYVDQCIGSLLHELERLGVLQNTYVIVTADHGQQFLERGVFGHGKYLYDELIRVPLVIVGPDLPARVIAQQVSLLDLAPSVLAMVGVGKPRTFMGSSLLPAMTGDTEQRTARRAISEADILKKRASVGMKPPLDLAQCRVSLRTEKWKCIHTVGADTELYDLVLDPKETENVCDARPDVANALKREILTHIDFVATTSAGKAAVAARVGTLKGSSRV